MRMVTELALVPVLIVLGLVGMSNKAHAVNSNISATACKGSTNILADSHGIQNWGKDAEWVTCPIVRSPTANNAVSVYVDGWLYSNGGISTTITCTLYSFNFDGAYLGSQSLRLPLSTKT
jgi:hypothetical protein